MLCEFGPQYLINYEDNLSTQPAVGTRGSNAYELSRNSLRTAGEFSISTVSILIFIISINKGVTIFS